MSLVSVSGRYLVTCTHCMCSIVSCILYLVLFAASCGSACVRGCMSTEASVEDSTAQIVTVQLYYYYSVTWPSWPLYSYRIQYTVHFVHLKCTKYDLKVIIKKCSVW